MNRETLKNNPEFMKAVGEQIGESMRQHGRREQQEKVMNFKLLNVSARKGQILFTGSSLMEQFPIAEIAQSHNLGKPVYNRGIGGYTTDDFLNEINTVLFDLEPSKLFINIGTNDINEDLYGSDWKNHLLTSYEQILKQIAERLPDTDVYMMAYYPVNANCANEDVKRFMLKTRTNENLNMINRELEALAVRFGFHFINANEGLTDTQGNLKEEYTKEGVHLYANAYEVVYRNLEAYL